MKLKYYLGYARNPYDEVNDGYETKKEEIVVLEHDGKFLKEYLSGINFFIVSPNQTIDGAKLFRTNSGLCGRILIEIKKEAVDEFFKHQGMNGTKKYLETLMTLCDETRKFSILKEKEFLNTIIGFSKELRIGSGPYPLD